MKKIIFFDIDGTLFDNETLTVPRSTVEALKQISQNEEIILALATGRTYRSIDVIEEIKDLFKVKVLINGQVIMYNDEIIYDNPMSKEVLNRMKNYLDEREIPQGFVGLEEEAVTRITPLVEACFHKYMIPLPKIDHSFHQNEKVYQSWIFAPVVDVIETEKNFPEFVFFKWADDFGADIISALISKAEGIKRVIELLGITKENVIAIGDGNNDYEMLEYAGMGIAMGNSTPKVKAIADYITKDINDDGLLVALKFLQLI